MRLIDVDALVEILKREEAYLRKNQADERADGILDAIMDAEDAPTIESKAYDEVAKIIADASFTGDDGLDYVETLVVLNAIKMDKTGNGRMKINLNEPVKVKLTNWGKEIFYHQYDRVNKMVGREVCKPRYPKEDENGYTEFQLWSFMELYGEHISMTLPNVIEPLEIVYESERGKKNE